MTPVHLEAGRACVDMRVVPNTPPDAVTCLDCRTSTSSCWFSPESVNRQLNQAIATRCIGVLSAWLLLRAGARRPNTEGMTVDESIAAATDVLNSSDPMKALHDEARRP